METANLTELSNEDLLQLYQKSEPQAFREFFERTHTLVFNFLLSRLRNRAEAEEAFQKTYFKVHRYVRSYDSDHNALTWLLTIARNVAFDTLREHRAQHENLDTTEDVSIPTIDTESAIEAKSTLKQIFDSLSLEEQSLLERRLFSEDSYEEISEAVGISEANIRKRVSRLLKRIKGQLSPTN